MMNSLINNSHEQLHQVMMEGAVEVIGPTGLHAIRKAIQLDHAQSLSEPDPGALYRYLPAFLMALEDLYGRSGGQGIAVRCGQASFKYLSRLPELDEQFSSIEYRLSSSSRRLKNGLKMIAEILARGCDVRIRVSEDAQNWYWQIDDNAMWRQSSSAGCPCCYVIGLLQEFITWTSGGRRFDIIETQCCTAGAESCRIQINKQPID